ncbi:hypothetical protein NUACC21_01210 [Scytonema sp. NUACC21]
MKAISILGSTGSIGTQTLDIVAQYPNQFRVVGLAAGRNVELLAEQIRTYQPQIAAICEVEQLPELQAAIRDVNPQPILLAGEAGVIEVARYGDAEVVVTGIVGCAGLLPTIAAIKAGKDIALANKETLIAGGPVVLPLVQQHRVKLLPADSEHSAIFQCLQGVPGSGLRRILLTASGGAFRDLPVEKLSQVTVADALKHPNGYALIQQVKSKAQERGQVVLAIAVTGYVDEKMCERALSGGFDLWFTKPLDIDEFVAVLAYLAICQQSSYAIAQRILGHVPRHGDLSLELNLAWRFLLNP